jgi:UDP-N-acetylglucosamine diphosphorylase/glucosamine-1-phosphate N-acetyltransferase
VDAWKQILPQGSAEGRMISYPWDLIEHNAVTLAQDVPGPGVECEWTWGPDSVAVVGPRERLYVHATAAIEPQVVVDTRPGPVIIDREADVQSFSRIEGPTYVGPQSQIVGAKIRASSIGPACRIGGEVEASIVHGYSNKYHDGFLGHSYVGEWVNLGAGTQTSDLRNDYGPVSVTVAGRAVETGLTKVGTFFGDHTKSGLGTLLNTGSVVGAFCNLLPSGRLLPRVVPSFSAIWHGQIQEGPELTQLVATAATAMRRRGCELTGVHAAYFRHLHEATAARRRQLIREGEQRRLRRSV